MSYCIDTSALIDIWRKLYPPENFPSLWEKIDNLINLEILIAPKQVLVELQVQRDELTEWAEKHRKMFKQLKSLGEVKELEDIMKNFPELVNKYSTVESADPFVIALAKTRNYCVITSETLDMYGKPKIPYACKVINVRYVNVLQFIKEQGWIF